MTKRPPWLKVIKTADDRAETPPPDESNVLAAFWRLAQAAVEASDEHDEAVAVGEGDTDCGRQDADELERRAVLEALALVDYVSTFEQDLRRQLLQVIAPCED
ncbi:MAG: hypothetical protein WBX25_27550 [Rhodomicrobium sp.]